MINEQDKKQKFLFMLGVMTILAFILGASYAYFSAQGGETEIGDVEVITHTGDSLSFETGTKINITADMSNFYENAPALEPQTTTATAILSANTQTKKASFNYYVYLDIIKNNFIHTVDDETTEILMIVTGPNGEVTSLNGLRYDEDLGGFDITEVSDLIKISPDDEAIAVLRTDASLTKTKTWTVTVKFINLATDQELNAGKIFNAQLVITKEVYTISDRCKDMNLNDCITQTVYTGIDGENNIYKHDGQGLYGILEAGLGTSYENSYRYSGDSNEVNNYVCFGGTCDDSGISENLYRIIGVFDNQVKLIKAREASSTMLGTGGAYSGSNNKYYWDRASGSNNTWSHSLLMLQNLNSGYTPGNNMNVNFGFLYNIDHGTDHKKWSDYITDHIWKVGGNTYAKIVSVSGVRNVYNNEIGSTNGEENYTNKVGLVYMSDFMYASDPSDASKPWSDLMGYDSDVNKSFSAVSGKNWLNPSNNEFSITRNTENSSSVFDIISLGYISVGSVVDRNFVRPTFYLNSDVKCAGGNGSITNPYTLK